MAVTQFHVYLVERRVIVVRNDHRCHESMVAGMEDGFGLSPGTPVSPALSSVVSLCSSMVRMIKNPSPDALQTTIRLTVHHFLHAHLCRQ